MSEFDPVVTPTNDPSYTRDSRPIDVPNNIKPTGVQQNQIMPHGPKEGDRSAEYYGKAAEYGLSAEGDRSRSFGDLFRGIVATADYVTGAADSLIKKDIENQVYNFADHEREQYTEALELIKGGPGGMQSFLDANAQMTEGDLPAELGELPQTLENMSGAGPSGTGRMGHTMYYGRLLSMAKDLRAKYPGYRAYIDNQFAKTTGVNPANAYIGQLLSEINRNATSGTTQRNKTLTFITQNAELLGPQASKLYRQAEQGIIGMPEVLDAARPKMAKDMADKEEAREIELFKGREDQLRTLATGNYQRKVERIAGTAVESIMVNTGTDEKAGLINFLQRAQQGEFKSDEIQRVGHWLLDVKIPEITRQLNKEANVPFGQSGRSYATILGLKNRNDINEAGLSELQGIAKALIAGETQLGIAFSTAREIQAKGRDFTNKIMSDPKIAPTMMMLNVVEKNGGQAAVSKLLQDALIEGWDQNMTSFHKDFTLQFRAQAVRDQDSSFVTLNDALKTGKKKQVPTAIQHRLVTEAMADLSRGDLSPAIKANIVQAAYGDGNLGFVEALNKDGMDSRRNVIPGTYITWREMTRPEVHSAMVKLRGVNEQLYANYVNWVETTQKNLFKREVANLNQIVDNPGYKFGYSIKDNKFWVDTDGSVSRDPSNKYYWEQLKAAKEAVNRINMGMDPIRQIAKTDGRTPEDVTGYILQKARESGINYGTETQGLPSKLYTELVNAALKAKKGEDRKKSEMEDFYRGVGR